jgi:hypothetical protein
VAAIEKDKTENAHWVSKINTEKRVYVNNFILGRYRIDNF